MKTIDVYEHGRLYIGEQGFNQTHWKAFVKLNALHDGAYFDVLHEGLKFKQYVGVIQVDGLLVQIHPKADKNDHDLKWKGVLIKMLKACGKVKAESNGNAQLRKQNINLLEVYFEYFLSEVEGLIHAGLVKNYRRETSNVKALKGKLEFAGNIRHNLVHKERFFTTHQVYDANHKLHQVLNHALEIMGYFCKGTYLSDRLSRVHLAFPEVNRIQPTVQFLDSIQLDRKTAPYERALELAKFIILNYSPDIHDGQQKLIALLFDMNVLWEEYVLHQLTKACANTNILVTGQSSKVFWGSYRTIRPDLVLVQNNTSYVIDTKWKRPSNQQPSIEDLRQMYTYARFWQAEKVMLLYPGESENSKFVSYHNHQFDLHKHQCKISFASVLDEYGELRDNLGEVILGEMGVIDGR